MGEYDGIKPQDDFGHSMDDEDDLSNYRPGMGAMVAMGYESGASDFEAFDMSHTWAPGMPTGYPHGPFDDPQMGCEFGDDGDPDAAGLADDYAEDVSYAAPSIVYEQTYGVHRPGWGAWQRPQRPGIARFGARRFR